MKGLIQEHPLAELIREISLAGLTGALRLERERVKFVLYFETGALCYGSSNLRPHRLVECLKRWGTLPEAELAAIKDADKDTKLLAALSATALFDLAALQELVERQVAEVLRPALLLTDGVWFFDARARLLEDVRAQVATDALAIESARRLPAEFIAGRFPRSDEKIAPEKNFPAHLNLLPQEGFVLSRVDAQTSVRALVAISGLSEAETLRALYALTLGGFLLRDSWPLAFTAEQIEKLRATAEAIEKGAPTQTVTNAGAQQKKEESVPVAPSAQAVKEELDQPRELEELFARMNVASNYYEVLGVGQRAELRDIKRAYHQLARRFHPDRFHQEQNRDLHARVESAFARIAQAYETLRDRQLRAAYDLKLKSPKTAATAAKDVKQQAANLRATQTDAKARAASSASNVPNPQAILIQAEENFQQGIAAMRDGQRARAVSLLREAARLAPRQPNYRAYYGRALAASEETRRMAEAEFQAAIALDGGNASYHVMLAELYLELGFQKRAQSIVEHALSLDSRNVAARLLLDKMKQK